MEIEVEVIRRAKVKTLRVQAHVRHWEDAVVNGEEDTNGDKIPCRGEDYWCPIIAVEKGKIQNWEQGKTATTHYKVCDAGDYNFYDDEGNPVAQIQGYVPKYMSPAGESYGDYIIMEIDENGVIQDWNPALIQVELQQHLNDQEYD